MAGRSALHRGWRNLALLVVLTAVFLAWQMGPRDDNAGRPADSGRPQAGAPQAEVPAPGDGAKQPDGAQHTDRPQGERTAHPRVEFPDQTIRDVEGRVSFRGTVDLTETLGRIERGERLRFSNDGTVFQNRERRLPKKPAGYYHEYVHPTPGLSGPGPQRVVIGAGGERYYTPDHYRTFEPIAPPAP